MGGFPSPARWSFRCFITWREDTSVSSTTLGRNNSRLFLLSASLAALRIDPVCASIQSLVMAGSCLACAWQARRTAAFTYCDSALGAKQVPLAVSTTPCWSVPPPHPAVCPGHVLSTCLFSFSPCPDVYSAWPAMPLDAMPVYARPCSSCSWLTVSSFSLLSSVSAVGPICLAACNRPSAVFSSAICSGSGF